MTENKRANSKQVDIKIGNVSDVTGNIHIAGGDIDIHTTHSMSAAEIKPLFEQLYTAIDTRAETSSADKEDLKAELKEIQATVTEAAQKNEKVDQGFLSRRFRNIVRMAPDVLDVMIATLANPLAGLGVAVKKIAERAKEDLAGS
jgi:hypothetical protein